MVFNAQWSWGDLKWYCKTNNYGGLLSAEFRQYRELEYAPLQRRTDCKFADIKPKLSKLQNCRETTHIASATELIKVAPNVDAKVILRAESCRDLYIS